MDAALLQTVLTGGSTAVLLVVLWFLWREYTTQTAWMREKFDELEARQKVIAQEVGLSTLDLSKGAARIRAAAAEKRKVNT